MGEGGERIKPRAAAALFAPLSARKLGSAHAATLAKIRADPAMPSPANRRALGNRTAAMADDNTDPKPADAETTDPETFELDPLENIPDELEVGEPAPTVIEPKAESPSATAEASDSGDAGDGEPEGGKAAPEEKAKPSAPTAQSRKKEVHALQTKIKGLDATITEEKRRIAAEVLTHDSLSTEREELPALFEQGRSIKAAKEAEEEIRNEIKLKYDVLQSDRSEKVRLDKERKEVHNAISSRYADVGRSAYEAFKGKPELAESLTPTFEKIIALDALIVEKQKEKDALDEQAKTGLLGKIKSSIGGLSVKVPTEADRDKVFTQVGGQVLADEAVAKALDNAEVNAVLEQLAEPIGEIRRIDNEIKELTEHAQGLTTELEALKGDQPSVQKRMAQLGQSVKRLEAEYHRVLDPLAEAYLSPKPETAGRTPELDAALGRLKEARVERLHARTQIERLRAENRIDELVKDREGLMQKRHKLAQQLGEIDRRLGDIYEEHTRLHGFVKRVASGASVELPDEEKLEPLEPEAPAPLEADKAVNSLGRARLQVTAPDGSTFRIELFGGEGIQFGRSHHDKQRNLRNDWVCRSLPANDPEAANRTRRISKVHGGVRGVDGAPWQIADWSSAGMTLDRAPLTKNGWIPIPPEPCVLDLASGAVVVTALGIPGQALTLRRPDEEGVWYSVIRQAWGLAVHDGGLAPVAPEDSSPGLNVLFKAGRFGVAPRGAAGDLAVGGAPLSAMKGLEPQSQITFAGFTLDFTQVEAAEPAV